MASKKKSTTADEVLTAASSWAKQLDAYEKHLSSHKHTFTQKQEAAWVDKFNRLQQESVKEGRALFELVKGFKPPKQLKKAA